MKEKLGAAGFITGIIGAGFAVGGVENAETLAQWLYVGGVAVSSIILMQVSVWMIKGEI